MSTINIDIPEADSIHVGDTLVGNIVYFTYSSPALFFPALNRIKERGRKNLISSHLELRSSASINHAIYYLNGLKKNVIKSHNEADVLQIDLKDCLPPGVEGTPFETMFHKRNLKFVVEQQLFA